MELDKEILEKICYDVYNSEYLLKNEHPTQVKLIRYEVVEKGNNWSSIDWVVKCFYSVPMNVNGVVREGWSYNGTQFVNKLEYEKEKTRLIRERKLKELGL